jgi:glycerol-3-phosphate acyltransferase PlsY
VALADAAVVKLALVIAVLVFARHHANIRRLIAGTEPRIGQKA